MIMKKNNKKTQKPRHHLFKNPLLNELLCSTRNNAEYFCQFHINLFTDRLLRLGENASLEMLKKAFLDYTISLTECAFNLGWSEANLLNEKNPNDRV